MIANTMEFPCLEASRCYITEKEHGLRLSYSPPQSKSSHPFSFLNQMLNEQQEQEEQEEIGKGKLSLTTNRTVSEEWYVHLDTHSTENGEVRIIQLVHCATGLYLSSSKSMNEDDEPKGTPLEMNSSSSHYSQWIIQDPDKTRIANRKDGGSSIVFSLKPHSYYYYQQQQQQQQQTHCAIQIVSPTNVGDNLILPEQLQIVLMDTTTRDLDGGEEALWELEYTSGELCFMSNPVYHSQIRCNPFGKLSMSLNFECQEVFRFIEVGNGHVVIATWSHGQTFYLSSDPDGSVFTTTNRLGQWERWYFEKTENGVFIISVAHKGRYLCIGKRKDQALQTTTKPNDFAKWHLEAAHLNTYHLKSVPEFGDMPFVSSGPRGKTFLVNTKRDWEEWKLERTTDGYITLFSTKHEQYLGSNSTGQVNTTKSKGDWSYWEMIPSPHGGIHLKSKSYNRHLAVTMKGRNAAELCTTEELFGIEETWRLEPRLPFFLSTSKIAALGTAGTYVVAVKCSNHMHT